jgi:hypothetical protein
VRLVTADGETIAGVAWSVGQDVLTLRVGSGAVRTAYVPLAAVAAVVVGA